jgi:hypothetical protein
MEMMNDEPMTLENGGYFGVCPQCRRNDGYANAGRSHWFFCKKHRVKWCAGSNLFSSWRDETEEEQRRVYEEIGLGEFEEIKPLHLPELEETGKQHPHDLPLTMAARKGVIDLIDIVNARNPDFLKWMCLRTVADLLTEQVHHLRRDINEAIDLAIHRWITEPDEQIPF